MNGSLSLADLKSYAAQCSVLGLGLHHCSLQVLLSPNRNAKVLVKKKLLFASAIAAVLLTSAGRAEESLQLKGTQAQKVMTIVRGTSPYVVTGTYEVPAESELIIEAGTKLSFAKDAALNIRGTLLIKGTKDSPVELSGKATGAGTWQGVRINRSPSTQIDYARITGAKNGICVYSCKPLIENTILTGNIVGLYAGEYGGGSQPTLKNCLITQNREDGVVLMASSAALERCTISRNGGWGIRGEYYASPSISWSIISENKKGGIWCWLYTCKVTAHGSSVARNKDYDVSNGSPETWDFSGNWWGTTETQILKSS
jgi:hypothetical protein